MRVPFYGVTRCDDTYRSLNRSAALDDWSASGGFCVAAEERLSQIQGGQHVRLTSSGTAALELAALQLPLEPTSNVIIPSFAFPACATAFTRIRAQVRFADVDPLSGSICLKSVARLLDSRTRAVVTIHYAGACWQPVELAALCEDAGVPLIEDCAHALGSRAAGRAAGQFGKFATFSFHHTKNISCGEGGAIAFGPHDLRRMETTYWSGTNRTAYLRGEVDAYEWVSEGGNFGLSQFQAAVLDSQLQHFEAIQRHRKHLWTMYATRLKDATPQISLPYKSCQRGDVHAAHIFYILFPDLRMRESVRFALLEDGIDARTHYRPLHSSPYAAKLGCISDVCSAATAFSERMLRLPLHSRLDEVQVDHITDRVIHHSRVRT